MNDLLTDPKSWVIGLITLLGAIVAWFFQRELARIDRAIAESVKRDEFNQLRRDMDARHTENVDKLDRIDLGITGTHQRIDALYRDLMDKDR